MTDKPVEPMTEAEIAAEWARHYPVRQHAITDAAEFFCHYEDMPTDWPCDTARLLATLDSLKAKVGEQADAHSWSLVTKALGLHPSESDTAGVVVSKISSLRAENKRLTARLLIPCPCIHPMDEVDKKLEALQAQLTAEQAAHEKTKAECSSLDIIQLREKLRASEEAREKCQASFDRVVGEREALRHAIRIKDEVIAERGVDLLDLRGQLRTLRSDLVAMESRYPKDEKIQEQARALEAADEMADSIEQPNAIQLLRNGKLVLGNRAHHALKAYRSLRSPAPKEETPKPNPLELPESIRGDRPCDRCGTEENIVWFTDSIFWNAVARTDDADGGILCINCFVTKAEALFKVTGWKLTPEWPWRQNSEAPDQLCLGPAAGAVATDVAPCQGEKRGTETPRPETCQELMPWIAERDWDSRKHLAGETFDTKRCGEPIPCHDHQETCIQCGSVFAVESSTGNKFCLCGRVVRPEEHSAKEKPKTHEFRCELDFGGKVLSERGHHNYEAGRCFQPVEHHLCTICSKPFSDPAHS